MKTTTPVIISKQIRDLCEKLDPEYKPFYIEVKPDKNAIPHECFENRNLNPLLLQAPDTYYKLPPEAWKPPDYKEFMQVNVLSAVIGAHTSSPVLPMLIREKTRANQG